MECWKLVWRWPTIDRKKSSVCLSELFSPRVHHASDHRDRPCINSQWVGFVLRCLPSILFLDKLLDVQVNSRPGSINRSKILPRVRSRAAPGVSFISVDIRNGMHTIEYPSYWNWQDDEIEFFRFIYFGLSRYSRTPCSIFRRSVAQSSFFST